MRKNPKEKKHPRIRRRVFAYLAAFVAFVLALLWLMQIVWLDDFYRWDKTRQITQAADAVESNIGNEQLSALIDRLAQQNDVCILLLDSDKHVFLSSDDIHYCLIHRMSSRDLSFWCSMIPENGNTLTKLFNIAPFGGDQYNSHQFRGNVPKRKPRSNSRLRSSPSSASPIRAIPPSARIIPAPLPAEMATPATIPAVTTGTIPATIMVIPEAPAGTPAPTASLSSK